MAYIKTNWVDNQTAITAARMNNIEDGIANNESAITQVETRIGTLSGIGQPIIATSADAMTDTDKIYLYVGSETGYETGHWYYYDTEWVDGGEYGSAASGISNNARNLLKYILERVAYTETGMQVYVDALYQALAEGGGGGGGTTTYTIINALTNVTNSNDATGCDEGDSYTGTLTADTDYTIDSVTVTMGGNDITSTAYDSSTGVITISSVTGDIVITATASITPTPSAPILSATQGNITSGSTDADKVTIVLDTLVFNPSEVKTISVPTGYQFFAFTQWGVSDISNAGTARATNQMNVYSVGSNGYVQNGNEANSRININNTTTWASSKVYTNTSSSITQSVTGIGIYIKKTDGSALTPAEAVLLFTIE